MNRLIEQGGACVHDMMRVFAESASITPARRAAVDRHATHLRNYLSALEVPECPETLEAFTAALLYVPRQVRRLGATPIAETVATMLNATEAVATLYYADHEALLSFGQIVGGDGGAAGGLR